MSVVLLGPVTITGGSPGTNTKLPVTFAVLAIVPFDGTLTTVTWNVTSTLPLDLYLEAGIHYSDRIRL